MLPGDRSGGVEIDIRGALKSTCTRRSPAVSKVDVGEDLDHRDRSVGTLPVEAQSGGQTLRFDRCSRVRGRELLGMAIPPTSLAAKPSGRSRSTVHRNVRIRATPSSSRHDAPHLVYVRSGESGCSSDALAMAWASVMSPFWSRRASSRNRVKPLVSTMCSCLWMGSTTTTSGLRCSTYCSNRCRSRSRGRCSSLVAALGNGLDHGEYFCLAFAHQTILSVERCLSHISCPLCIRIAHDNDTLALIESPCLMRRSIPWWEESWVDRTDGREPVLS